MGHQNRRRLQLLGLQHHPGGPGPDPGSERRFQTTGGPLRAVLHEQPDLVGREVSARLGTGRGNMLYVRRCPDDVLGSQGVLSGRP